MDIGPFILNDMTGNGFRRLTLLSLASHKPPDSKRRAALKALLKRHHA